jgi:5-methylcytosine-specific restriction protein A
MLKTIKHGINLIKHSLRDVGISAKRSSRWPTLEKHFKAAHPTCAACGSKKRLNVHHCMPFHLDPSLELDPNNLITLCMGAKECHLRLGHGGSFKQYCPDVRKYAAEALAHPDRFDDLVQKALANRKVN